MVRKVKEDLTEFSIEGISLYDMIETLQNLNNTHGPNLIIETGNNKGDVVVRLVREETKEEQKGRLKQELQKELERIESEARHNKVEAMRRYKEKEDKIK